MTQNPNKYIENDQIAIDLKVVADEFYKEDIETREIQVRYWKRLKYYWNNFSQIYWSDSDNGYRIFGHDSFSIGTDDQAYYDKPVNVFKAFLETIIAALSVQIPAVNCVPDDADDALDISTAKAGNLISSQIYKHNNAILLWLQALYVYCTEGLIAMYTYTHESEEYGTYKEKKYKREEVDGYACPNCGIELDEDLLMQAKLIKQSQEDQFDPNDNDSELDYLNESEPINEIEQIVCPQCSTAIDPNLEKSNLIINRFDGFTTKPKSRICMEVYGGLYVKVPLYAKKQSDMPYLIFSYETHYVNPLQEYPALRDKLPQGGWSNQGMNDPYEQYARLNIQYRGTYPSNTVTVKECWLRPSSFNILPAEKCDELKKKYPNGAKVVFVNDICAHYCAESLDDHWTLTHNPLSDYLSHEPLGEVLTNIQDIVNDLISLTLQTIEHGIEQTWADPSVVNFDQYSQLEATPGTITPTKQVANNKNISQSFHSTKTASLSPEVFNFYRIINELGQFVSGALPSLFGGSQPGSETASEYAMAKGMALQRLQTPWKMLTIWWKITFSKVIPQYMKMMVEDERIVQKDDQGNFINVFIRKAETQGKIGDIELEAADQLPITDDQQKDVIMQLMQLNNMEIMNALIAPENLPYIRKIVRIPQFKLPGEDDRTKQYEEITELVNTQPIVMPPDEMQQLESVMATGQPAQPAELPSVEIDMIVDNHKIEADICRSWLISDAGRLAKIENPEGYKNVLLHMQQHVNALNEQMAMQQASQTMMNDNPNDKQKTPSPKGNAKKGSEKIEREGNGNFPIS